MKKKYLIDVNLPYYFSIWNNEEYIHQKDIDDEWSDEQIWHYAIKNDLTIVTKDSDFSNKILFQNPPPRVIHIRFGNMKLSAFFEVINKTWPQIKLLSNSNKLVSVYLDRIEAIN